MFDLKSPMQFGAAQPTGTGENRETKRVTTSGSTVTSKEWVWEWAQEGFSLVTFECEDAWLCALFTGSF